MASSITIDFNAQLSKFTSAIDKATSDLNKFQTNASRISASVNKSFGALGLGFSAVGVASFVKGTIDALDQLNDLNKSTGIAVEQLAGLGLAAEQSGGDLESIASSINKLSVNIGQNADKFKALGISAKEPLEAFKQLSDIYTSIEDPQKRAAFAAEALGKSWAGAAPLLAEGSKNIQAMVDNGTRLSGVTEENVKQAAAFNSQLDELKILAKSAALPLLPALSEVAKLFQDATRETDLFTSALNKAKLVGTAAAPGFAALINAFDDDESKRTASGKIKFRPSAAAAEGSKKIDAFLSTAEKGTKARAGSAGIDRNAEEAKRFIESLTKEFETLGMTGTALKQYEAAHLKLTPAQKAVVADTLKKIDAFDEEQKRLEKLTEAYENHQRVMDDFNDRELEAIEEASFADSARTEELERQAKLIRESLDPSIKLYDEIGKVQALQSNGLLDQEEADAAIKKLEDNFNKVKEVTEANNDVAKQLGLTFSSAFEDAIVGGQGFREILAGIEQDLSRIITRKLVTEPAADWITKQIGSFDFSALFSAKGNAFDGSGLIPFANGGIVNAATPFSFGGGKLGVMGEAGPEAILPLKRGSDGKLGVQAGGGVTIQGPLMVINTPNADSFRRSETQVAAGMQRALNRGRRVS